MASNADNPFRRKSWISEKQYNMKSATQEVSFEWSHWDFIHRYSDKSMTGNYWWVEINKNGALLFVLVTATYRSVSIVWKLDFEGYMIFNRWGFMRISFNNPFWLLIQYNMSRCYHSNQAWGVDFTSISLELKTSNINEDKQVRTFRGNKVHNIRILTS